MKSFWKTFALILFAWVGVLSSMWAQDAPQYHTVVFMVENPSDGSMEVHSQMLRLVGQNQTIGTMPQDPFRAGQTFRNWVEQGSGVLITAETVVNRDINAEAVFDDINIYEVRINYYYHNCVSDEDEIFDHTVLLLDDRKIGEGKSVESPTTVQVSPEVEACTPGASGRIFYPEQQTVTITTADLANADANRKLTLSVKYIPYNATYSYVYKLKDLTGDGYTEIPNSRENNVHGVIGSTVTATVKNFDYADFERTTPTEITQESGQKIEVFYTRKNFLLSFNTNGGSPVNSIQSPYGSMVEIPSSEPTRTGYTFDGWYYDANFTQRVGTKVTLDADKTLYAKWKGNTVPYTIVYMKEKYNNQTGTTEWVYDNSRPGNGTVGTHVCPSSAPTLTNNIDGYERDAEWNNSNGNCITIAADGSSVLTVRYKLIRYTIVFNISRNNGRINIGGREYSGSNYRIENVVLGQNIGNLWPSSSNEIYSSDRYFDGWTGGPSTYITKQYEVVWNHVKNANGNRVMTYTASWETSSYNRNAEYWLQQPDGSYEVADEYTQIGLNTNNLGGKIIDGYTLLNTTPNGYSNSGYTNLPVDVWVEPYDDTYTFNGSNYNVGDVININGHQYRITKKVERNGYHPFNPYSYTAVCHEDGYWKQETRTIYVYRFYYNRNTYDITYYYGSTILKTVQNVRFGANINTSTYNYTPSSKPSGKEDYTWCGWKADSKLQTDYVFDVMPSNNLALYACWQAPQYTVTFNNNYEGASEPFNTQTIDKDKCAEDPGLPSRPHYEFEGWFTDPVGGTRYTVAQQVTADITLYAHWKLNQLSYTVKYVKYQDEEYQELFTDKTVTSPVFELNQVITENALSIVGYIPDASTKSLTLDYENNVITFVYSAKKETNSYSVRYVLCDNPTIKVHEDDSYEVDGSTYMVYAMAAAVDKPYMTANGVPAEIVSETYYPDQVTKDKVLGQDAQTNVIEFCYYSYSAAKFTIQWVDMDGNPIEGVASVTESAKTGSTKTINTNINGYTFHHIDDGVNHNRTNPNYDIPADPENIVLQVFMQKNITITANNKTKTYDATPLVSSGVGDATVVGLPGGFTLSSIEYDGSRTDVGTENTTPKNAVIVNKGGQNKTDHFHIEYVPGVLTVTPLSVTITFNADRWNNGPCYNGEERTIGFRNQGSEIIISNNLYNTQHGDEIRALTTGISLSKTDAGPADNSYKYILHLSESMFPIPVDPNYEVTVEVRDGELTICPAQLTVTTDSDEKPYDGTPLTNSTVSVTGLVNNETVTATTTGSQTKVGESTNTYTIDWGTTNQNNYIITEELGTLKVTLACEDVTLQTAADAADCSAIYILVPPQQNAIAEGATFYYKKNDDAYTAYVDGTDLSFIDGDKITWKVEFEGTEFSTCEQTFTVEDKTKPIITLNSESKPDGYDWGCNPTNVVDPQFTYTDNCDGTGTVTNVTSTVTTVGCQVTKVWKAGFSDAAGNKADTVRVTYTWTAAEAPVIDAIDDVTATPAGNCTYTMPDLSSLVLLNTTSQCGGEVSFESQSVESGHSYTQGNRAQKIPVTVKVKDTCGSEQTATVNVIIPANDLNLTMPADVAICNGQSTQLSATSNATTSNATTFAWSPATGLSATNVAEVTANPTETTEYTLTVTNANGCTTSGEVTVTVNPLVELSATNLSQTVCANTAIEDVEVTVANATVETSILPAGLSFDNENNKITGTPTTAGSYEVDIIATSNKIPACDPETVKFTLTVNPLPVASIDLVSELCPNVGTIVVKAHSTTTKADYAYAWTGNGLSINSKSSANTTDTFMVSIPQTCGVTYKPSLVITDGNGCVSDPVETTIKVKTPAAPTITAKILNQDFGCNFSGKTNPTAANFEVTDECASSPVVTLTPGEEESLGNCQKRQIFTASYTNVCGTPATPVAITYTWTDALAPTIEAVADQAATAKGGCEYVIPDLSEAVLAQTTDNCGGTPTIVSQMPAAGTVYAQTNVEKKISVKVTVKGTCDKETETDVYVVIPANDLNVTVTAPVAGCPGASYEFTSTVNGGHTPYTYEWSGDATGDGTKATIASTFDKTKTYTATLTITDDNGCVASDTKTLTITDNEKPTCPATPLTISLASTATKCEFTSEEVLTAIQTQTYGSDNCTNATELIVAMTDNSPTYTYGNTHPTAATASYTLTDKVGNEQTCSATVVVTDAIAPVCSGLPATLTLKTPCSLSQAEVEAAIKEQNSWSDNCTATSAIEVTISGVPATMVPGDQATAQISLDDTHGNTVTDACSQIVKVEFEDEPDCPTLSPVTLEVQSGCALTSDEAAVLLRQQKGTKMDFCGNEINGVLETLSAASYPVSAESYTANWSFQLTANITKTGCPQSFTVVDKKAPVCPTNTTKTHPDVCKLTAAEITNEIKGIVAGYATALDNCTSNGDLTVAVSSPTELTANGSETYSYTITDAYGNAISTCVQTIAINLPDFTIPTVTSSSTVQCLADAKAPHEAGSGIEMPEVNDALGTTLTYTGPVEGGTYTTTACAGTKTYTYTYTDCANHTHDWTYTYTIELVNPTIVLAEGKQSTYDLGCNPTIEAPTASYFKVTDVCNTSATATVTPGTKTNISGCLWEQVFTASYANACGKEATPVTITYTWKEDKTAPVISLKSGSKADGHDWGCNPTVLAPEFEYTDNCDSDLTIEVASEGPKGEGCDKSQTWKANVTDKCGNAASEVVVTYTWKEDREAPVITVASSSDPAGACNPTIVEPTFQYTDNCDNDLEITVATTGAKNTSGCMYSQTWTANVTDKCGNPATEVTVTYTWIEDKTNPVITLSVTTTPAVNAGTCKYTVPNVIALATISDNCTANADLQISQSPAAGEYITENTPVTITVVDGCNNKSEKVITVTLPEVLQGSITSAESFCFNTADGVIEGTFEGGQAPYSLRWSGAASGTQSDVETIKIEDLPDGDYTVTVSDVNGCQVELTATIAQLSQTITVTANSANKVYDGSALTETNYTVDGTLESGDQITDVVISGSQTEVGTSVNQLVSFKIMRNGVDVACYYNTVKKNGTLEVKCKPVTITAATHEFEYDGTAHSDETYTVVGLVGDDAISAVVEGSIQYVSQSPVTNVLRSYAFTSGNANNYCVTTADGELKMKYAGCTHITITANSESWKYDKEAHTSDGYTIKIEGGESISVGADGVYRFGNGDELTVDVTGTITNVSQSPVTNNIAVVSILNGSVNVSDAYCVTPVTGNLEVTKRAITFTSATAEKVYDGTPLTNHEVYASDDNFVTGEGASFTVTGTQTLVGSSKNTFTYSFNEGTDANNYEVTKVEGTLTVIANTEPITITSSTKSWTYDCQLHKDDAYTVTYGSQTLSANDANGNTFTLPTGDVLTITSMSEGVKYYGSYSANNTFTYEITNGSCYTGTRTVTPGTLSIDKKELTITADDAEKAYDGTALTKDTYSNTALASCDHIKSVTVTGSQTEVGTSSNVASGALIEDADEVDRTSNYAITYVEGTLRVTPIDVTVTITGHNNTTDYDGESHTVTGYNVEISNPLYKETDFTFSGTAEAARTDVGTTNMGLKADQFTNTNPNFGTVTFDVTDGYQTITNAQIELICPSGDTLSKVYNAIASAPSASAIGVGDETIKIEYSVDGGAWSETVPSITDIDTIEVSVRASAANYDTAVCSYTLAISPLDVIVTIVGNSKTVVYDGVEHDTLGYVWSANTTLYTVDDFKFTGDSTVSGKYVGTYPMNLDEDQFENVNSNFGKVTFNVTDGELVITPRENVVVTITKHSETVIYDGEEHTVSGYEFESSDPLYIESYMKFTGEEADSIATGTEIGSYGMTFDNTYFENINENFKDVTFVVNSNDSLVINALEGVIVTITEHADTFIYDGEAHTVKGYDVAINSDLYKVSDFTFNGDSTISGTTVGKYSMPVEPSDFVNNNVNFKDVTFVVVPDTMVINPRENVIVTITKHSDAVIYDGEEHTVTGYDFESTDPLYIEEYMKFNGNEADSTATGTAIGSYGMTFDETYFENINENFKDVTFVVNSNDSLVINALEGIIVTITEHADTFIYDGEVHTVTGYEVDINNDLYKVSDFTFNGDSTISGTTVGEYSMPVESTDFVNNNVNFKDVTFVIEDRAMVINPRENIVVTIIPHSDTVKYTSSKYTVSGYDVIIPDPMYQESDILFDGVAETSGTLVGEYPMELTSEQFTNNNTNFQVVFDIKEGGLVIMPNDTVVVYVHEHGDEVVYDGQRHEVTEFHYTFNNEFCRVGKVKRDRTKKYLVEGTEVGVYHWGLQESYFSYDDDNFVNVKFVIIPDSLVILPRTDVEVTIVPNTDTFTYDGEMHTVTHYTIVSSDSLFTEQDLIFHGNDTIHVKDAGEYEMNILATDFESVNPNFGHVTFKVKEGQKTVVEPMRGVEVVISTHGDSIAYDGTAHTVSGFEVEANSELYKREFIDFSGDSTITATEVGEYTMVLNPSEFANNNKNFEDVTFIINSDNKLVIESLDGVQVVLKKHGAVVSYNGQPQTVSGYDLISISDSLYHADYFSYIGTEADTIATRTTIGTAVMSLSADDFQNNNETFADVRFIILEDTLTVVPNDHEVVVIREGAKLVPFDGQEHMVTGYTLVSSTDGAYTTSSFTFSGCDTVRGKEVGAYSMNLKAEDFTNIDTNYVNVTFVIEEDSLAIVPLQSIVVTIYEHADTFTFDGKEHIVSGYDIESSISYYDAKDFDFVGDSVIKKTNAGEYKMNLKVDDFKNTNENFTDVTFNVVPAVTKILPKETLHVTIYGNIDTVIYNGGFQEVKGYTWEAEEGFEFYKEFKFTGNDVAKGVKIGDYYMGLKESDFRNTSSNYKNVIFEVVDGYIHIDRVPIPIIVSANTGSKIYDGKEYQNTGYSYTRNALQTGDRITAVIQGRITNVGTVENRVVSYKILRGTEDVTANYNFGTAVHGTLTILPRTVVLTSADSTKLYDGTPLTQDSIRIEADGWAEGEGADIQITGKQLEVGESRNTFTYELWENTDLHNYEIEEVYGTLTVTSNTDEVIIAAANDTFLYDGKEHSSNHYRIVSGYIGQGDSLIVDVDGVITEAGKAANKVVGYRVVRGAMDVTDYYTFGTPVDGTLLVQKRKVTLISGSAEREYNGEELTNDTIFVEGDGWAEGEGAIYTVTGSRLYPGDTANKFTYELDANTLAKNYTITKREGKLTVLMNTQVLDITAASATKMYDGTPLEDSSFTYTEGILAEGDILYVKIEGSITEVGVDTNRIVDYRIMRGDLDVTDFYTIGEVNNGILRVQEDLQKLPFVIVGKDHSIEMYNVNAKVRVYDMLGRLVKIDGAFEVEVGAFYHVDVMNQGVYVVFVEGDKEGYKVIVR